ncbi:MAG: hypothetical protein CL927_19715 [Deltaproteobacteria bacterium]|nr:hypothetical protein [Deltaproteobacteria bacterium]
MNDDARRMPGPPPPTAVRTVGDPDLAALVGRAVAHHGRVERATHHFHTYPAGMHPDSARDLIGTLDTPAPGIHDPFCGGGTVPTEALLAGRPASGTDLSPIALWVTRTRTARPEHAGGLRRASRKIAALAREHGPVRIPEIAHEWYEPHVLDELGRIRAEVEEVEDPSVQKLLLAVLSSIVIKASFRESDTSNRRRPYHRPPGTTAILFHKKARELGRMLDQLPGEGEVRVRLGDARRVGPPKRTGLVLTSPPYPGVYDYVPMQQLRYAWLDLDPSRGMVGEVGSRRQFRSQGRRDALAVWRKDTRAWIACQAERLLPGGFFAITIGDGLVGGRPVDTLGPTVGALESAGLTIAARASADRPDHARATTRTEHLVLARRPVT